MDHFLQSSKHDCRSRQVLKIGLFVNRTFFENVFIIYQNYLQLQCNTLLPQDRELLFLVFVFIIKVFSKMEQAGSTPHFLPSIYYMLLEIICFLTEQKRLCHWNTIQLFFHSICVILVNGILLEKCWFPKTKFVGKEHIYFTYIYFYIFNIYMIMCVCVCVWPTCVFYIYLF